MKPWRQYAGLATGLVVGATIVSVSAHEGDASRIHACVNPAGQLRIVAPSDACRSSESPLDWNVQGQKGDKGDKGDAGVAGPPGTFTGTFTSPNQQYRLSVTDDGIELAGPVATIVLDAGGIEIRSDLDLDIRSGARTNVNAGTSLVLKSAASANLESAGVVTIKGAIVDITP